MQHDNHATPHDDHNIGHDNGAVHHIDDAIHDNGAAKSVCDNGFRSFPNDRDEPLRHDRSQHDRAHHQLYHARSHECANDHRKPV